jgi:hypothetical protein
MQPSRVPLNGLIGLRARLALGEAVGRAVRSRGFPEIPLAPRVPTTTHPDGFLGYSPLGRAYAFVSTSIMSHVLYSLFKEADCHI